MSLLKKTYLFLIAFFIAYPVLYLVQFWRIKGFVDEKDLAKVTAIAQMLEHSGGQKTDELFLNMFDVYRQTGSLSYYVVRDHLGQLVYPSSEHALTQEAAFQANTPLKSKHQIQVQDRTYSIFLGKDEVPFQTLLLQLLKDQKEILLVFVLGIVLLIQQVAAYFLHFDLKHLIQWFKGRSRSAPDQILSSEGQSLKEYIQRVEDQRQQATNLAQEYKNNSYSGLTWAYEQIQAGTRQARLVVGRCDINSYTVLKQQIAPELLQYIVQTFFNRGGEYLNRYGAYKENASGDEIAFFVPASESPDPEKTALHVVRGLFEIFEDLCQEISLPQLKLTAKAALDSGPVELEMLGGTSETEGQPFINTARFLGTITNKDLCSLTFLSEHKDAYAGHLVFHHEALATVKNYVEPFALVYSHRILAYSDGPQGDLQFYKTDRDLTRILQEMTTATLKNDTASFHRLRGHVSSLKIARLSAPVVQAYHQLLKTSLKSLNVEMLSGTALLAKTLFTMDSAPESILTDLTLCLTHSNRRVVSNAREAIYKLQPTHIHLREYLTNEDHRVATDSLIDLVKTEGLTDEFSELLISWLQSKNSAVQVAALYAAYKVSSFWRDTNPEYVSLNPNFQTLDAAVRRLPQNHPALKKWLVLYRAAA